MQQVQQDPRDLLALQVPLVLRDLRAWEQPVRLDHQDRPALLVRPVPQVVQVALAGQGEQDHKEILGL